MNMKTMKNKNITGSFILLLTAIIWGSGFVAQSAGMDFVGPFTFSAVRNLIGSTVLIPVIIIFYFINKNKGNIITDKNEKKERKKYTVIGGICCGILLCIASNFQQIGIIYTTVGKAGFITAMYVVIVPVLGVFFKRRASILVWIAVVLAVVGLYLLCMTEGSLALSIGDGLELICAFVFSIHIMVIDYFSPKADGLIMSCIQFYVCGLLSAVAMFFTEEPSVAAILDAYIPILYAGLMSTGAGYTLQIIGQKGVHPTVASLIMSLESVVSVIAGWLILGQSLTLREILGCVIMFAAVVLAQLRPESNSE